MRTACLTLLLLSHLATAQAQRPDPLKSPECGQALAALEQARGQDTARVEQLRREAARACLGHNDHTRAPTRAPFPPVAVIPPVVAPPRAAAPLPRAPHPTSPPSIQRPPVVTACDAAGCWDSNGNRLNRAGPVLLGPQGVCTQVGGVLSCP